MAKQVTSWQSDDGAIWPDQVQCVTYECLVDLFIRVPELRDREAIVRKNVEALALSLKPLADLAISPVHPTIAQRRADSYGFTNSVEGSEMISVENHPEASPENHPEDEDHGGCDCGALLAGNAGAEHLNSCPVFRPSNKPRWDACHPAGDGQGRHEG